MYWLQKIQFSVENLQWSFNFFFLAVENPFASLGAGTPVFGSKSPSKKEKSKTGGKSDEEDNEGNDDYDPHYEPVVPLPDMIVVSTGEEEETAVFNERSKLFRFDGNEWKERGVGQLKVLHHPEKSKFNFYKFVVLHAFQIVQNIFSSYVPI